MSRRGKRRSGGSPARNGSTTRGTAAAGRGPAISAGLLSTLMAGGTVGMADVYASAARDGADAAFHTPSHAVEGRQHSGPDTIYAGGADSSVDDAAAKIGESILEGFMDQCGSGETGQPAADAVMEDLGPLPRPAVSPLGLVTIGEDAR